MKKQKEITILSPEEFRRMQLVQLEMLVELDRVCRENDIKYSIFCGTLLGAVRHKGYIPWDDDADVVMLREEYDKFKKVCAEGKLNKDICFFQDHDTDPEYRWGYGKLRRTGTKFVRVGQEHLKCKTGVFIDIFPLDDVPKSLLGQRVQDIYCYCLRKILWSEVGKYQAENPLKRVWFSLLSKIPADFVYKLVNKMTAKSKNKNPNRVRVLLFPATGMLYMKHRPEIRYGMPKKWFLQLAEYEFEGHSFYGTKKYDNILRYTYGDYMKLPPVEERDPHSPVCEYYF